MTKDILIQYVDIREAVIDLRQRIEKLEEQIQRIEDERYVTDSVTGGYGGTEHFMMHGWHLIIVLLKYILNVGAQQKDYKELIS